MYSTLRSLRQLLTERMQQLQLQRFARFGRFATVGALTTGIDLVLFLILREGFGLPTLLANTISYSTGIIVNFTLNRRWTYTGATPKAVWLQFLQFCAVSLTGLALNNLLVLLLDKPLATLFAASAIRGVISKMIATGGSMTWNYLLNWRWTFRARRIHDAD